MQREGVGGEVYRRGSGAPYSRRVEWEKTN